MHVFDVKTLKAKGGIDKETGYELDGDYFGLPWPCYGTPELKHPGSPNLYDTSKHVMDGGGNFRANFGVERDGVSLLAEDGSHSLGADITTGYPEFDHVLLKKLGWWDDLTEAEKKAAEGKNWKTDPSGGIIRVAMKVHGCHPFGNAKARAWSGTSRPDPAAPRAAVRHAPGHGRQVPDPRRQEGLLAPAHAVQDRAGQEHGGQGREKFPLIMTSGRLVEYEGGGEETRSNPWLAELQQEMFVEINPKAADRGIRNGERVGQLAHRRTPQGAGAGHRARGARHGVDAVPLLRPLAGRRHAGVLPEGAAPWCAARPSTPPPPTATTA
jgi:formate dehydrogenase major subunit